MDVLSSDSTVGEGCVSRGGCRASKAPPRTQPLSLLGPCHAPPIRKLNDPGSHTTGLTTPYPCPLPGDGGARRKKRRSSSARLSVTCVGRPCGQAYARWCCLTAATSASIWAVLSGSPARMAVRQARAAARCSRHSSGEDCGVERCTASWKASKRCPACKRACSTVGTARTSIISLPKGSS